MQDEIEFLPDDSGVDVKGVVMIAGGFFVFVQVFFLDSLASRVAFSAAFAVFLLVGFWFSRRSAKTWPQKIVMSRAGISYGNLQTDHGVELIPWLEIDRMDLFHTDPRLPPHLRIGLKPGSFRDQVKKSRLQRLSMGLDVNIPVSVNVTPDEVLKTAQQLWEQAGKATV
ncbi:MAG: hypothetical protein H6978_04425 [Gammaproteobacteria bacterium]|nr:hypothetical protein [Gammaproteobacteria bacterium]